MLNNILEPKSITVILTQAFSDKNALKIGLESKDINVYELPCITFKRPKNTTVIKKLGLSESYDFFLFTSRNAVLFFDELLAELGQDIASQLRAVPTIAVGEATANVLKEKGFSVAMVPQEFSSAGLAREISGIEGKKILIPRSQLADDVLVKALEAKGALVTPFILYTTNFIENVDEKLEEMLAQKPSTDPLGIYVTFTSPSTVTGFTRRLRKSTLNEVFKSVPAVCIGPVTEAAARKAGFEHVLSAEPHTTDGILKTILKL